MMGKNVFIPIIFSFLIYLLISLPFLTAQNSHFNPDMIKVAPGLILQYDVESINEVYNVDDGVPDFDSSTDNETITIVEIDYLTGFLNIKYQWRPIEDFFIFYNSSMDRFGEIVIYVNWEYWKNNISTNTKQLTAWIEDDAAYDLSIIDDDKNFGYFITQEHEVNSFGRISKHYNEKKLLYSKVYGVKTEEYYSTTETGPNSRTEYKYRSYILTTDLGVTTELDTQGLFTVLFVLGIVIILTIIILKYRKSKRD
ncbi:MAG: hypothetical protein GPJ54_07640 [Candidatus Heimdallarchaeota archaeon]|nr:hypothetical protein [Candidatus Heimdallarchaeota archaeon]